MSTYPITSADFLARAEREEEAARRSLCAESRIAHEELARLCRERANGLRRRRDAIVGEPG